MADNTVLPGTGETYAAVDRAGVKHQKVIAEINSPLTAFGDLRVAELSPVFQHTFEYTVDNTELTTSIVTAGGTVTQADAMAVVTSSTTTGSVACIQSRRQARYRSGLGGMARFTAMWPTGGIAATEQYAGLVDEEGSSAAFKNGFVVGFDGTALGIHRFANDAKSSVAQASWDDPLDGTGASGMTIDTAKLNVFQIQFQYLGAGAIIYSIEDDSTGQFVVFHTMQYANANTVPSSYMPNFHIMMYVNNKATTTSLILKTASFAYFIEGATELIQVHQPQQSSGSQSKTTVTTEVPIFTIRNKATYQSKTNFIEILMELVSCSVEAGSTNNLADIRFVGNGTLGGTPSYSDINTSDSLVDIDTAATSVSGGKELLVIPLAGKNDKIILPVVEYKFLLAPGDTITVAGSSDNSATIKASALWKELF